MLLDDSYNKFSFIIAKYFRKYEDGAVFYALGTVEIYAASPLLGIDFESGFRYSYN